MEVQTHGVRRLVSCANAIEILQKTICFLWLLIHLSYLVFIPFSLDELCILHVGVGGMLVVLVYMQSSLKDNDFKAFFAYSALFCLCIVCTWYFFVYYDAIMDRVGRTTFTDAAYSAVFIVTVADITGAVQPYSLVTVTVYVPAIFTVSDASEEPSFHK